MASGGRRPRGSRKEEEEKGGGFGAAGAILAGLAGIAGLAIAGKVIYDKYKEEDERKAQMMQRDVAASKRRELDMFDDNFGSSSRRSSGRDPDVPRPLINWSIPQLDSDSDEDAVSDGDFDWLAIQDALTTVGHIASTTVDHIASMVEGRESGAMSRGVTPYSFVEEAFSERLQNYYKTYADVDDESMWRAGQVVDGIKNVIWTYLWQSESRLGITALEDCGSFGEGLQVISPDECDVLIPIELPRTMWALVEGGTLQPRTPGYHQIRRLNSADHPMGSSPYDEYVVDDYLSPVALITGLKAMIGRAAKGITQHSVKYDDSGPDMTLHVTYDGSRYIDIDFVPAILIGSRRMVAAPHHDVSTDPLMWIRWRESYHVQERDRLARWSGHSYCHLKILKIMKAIRLNNRAQFGTLSSYVYKTLLLEMMTDGLSRDQWTNDDLQERFIDMLHLLQGHLLKRRLPHAFDPNVNLLDSVSPAACTALRNHIASLIGNQRLEDVLSRSYRGKYGHVGAGSPFCDAAYSTNDVVYY